MNAAAPRQDRPAVLAVDVGNSKTDVALVAADGDVLAAVRGPTASHQAAGLETGMAALEMTVRAACSAAGLDPDARPVADEGVFCMAGADYPSDVRLLSRALAARRLAGRLRVLNDTIGALRAGTDRAWGVVLVCGAGVNGMAVGRDGRTARFPSLGSISGDWGGGHAVGMAGLAAAVRGRDGRGPRTELESAVPAYFGLRRPAAITEAIYHGRLSEDRIAELSPVVLAAARLGDPVARSIVDRLAGELVAMATALIRRRHLARLDPDVVLAGGVFRSDDEEFFRRISTGVASVAPAARLVRLAAPPVLGAALIGLDLVTGDSPTQRSRVRAGLTESRVEPVERIGRADSRSEEPR